MLGCGLDRAGICIPGFVSVPGGTDEDLESGGVFTVGVAAPFGEGCISPLAPASLFVKDEIAHPAHEASFCGVPILGAPVGATSGGGRTLSGNVCPYRFTLCRYCSRHLLAWSRTIFSLSINDGHTAGRIFIAQSSSVKKSEVAASAIRAALRAWTKGSRNDRVKAATSTFVLVLGPRFFAIFPKQIVVFVRMPGCSSFAVFARCRRSSPLITRSDSFGTTTKTALTVCSRTTGARSAKPVT